MDVLKDVKEAEVEAEKIDAEYRKRVAELLEQGSRDWVHQREKGVASVNAQLEKYSVQLRQALVVDKERVHQEGQADLERLQQLFDERREAAVTALTDRLNRR